MSVLKSDKWSLQLGQEWTEWLSGGYNWRNFTLIRASYEDEECIGQRELCFALLGFTAVLCWSYETDHPMKRRIEEQIKQLSERSE